MILNNEIPVVRHSFNVILITIYFIIIMRKKEKNVGYGKPYMSIYSMKVNNANSLFGRIL